MRDASAAEEELRYLRGFANEFESEALHGALPLELNSPQKPPLGLVSELISGTTFVAPRAMNRRSYVFRIRPTACEGEFVKIDSGDFLTAPLGVPPYPGPLRWKPFADDGISRDFIEGMYTLCANGSPKSQTGMAIHMYRANRSMEDRAFGNADAEMIILPQLGRLRIASEMGRLDVVPGEMVLMPRGIKFRVELIDDFARGFVAENYGQPMMLPDLGLIGSHGLANSIDFLTPVAAFEDVERPVEYIHKFGGQLWSMMMDHSPFDVVAWRGNLAPCKYDMWRFVAMGSATVDHPDPSIYCALTSASSPIMGGNLDFMILPPRWITMDNTFRPPGFHRNSVGEFLGLIEGKHDSKSTAFVPGAASLHNNWTAHGPDVVTLERARAMNLAPAKIEDALVFMFESRYPVEVPQTAMDSAQRERDYAGCWSGFQRRFAIQ